MDAIDALSPAPNAEDRDQSDMERLMGGHDAALNDLMERHAAGIFHFLCRMTGSEEDAHDLAQETFVRVFRSRHRFQAGQRFSTWLYAIAANLARNHFRWRARHPAVSLEAESPAAGRSIGENLPAKAASPDDQALAVERAQAVRAAVRQLPEELREAVILCEWEEQSVAAAAEILGATPKAVESRLYRARQRLREQLKGWL